MSKKEEVITSKNHTELIDGIIVTEYSNTELHNTVVKDMVTAISDYLRKNKTNYKIFSQNVTLYIDDDNYFLPDVMILKDNADIIETGVHAGPLFIAEITSEETKRHDYFEKLKQYRKIGVDEYWIVDLQRKMIYKYLKSEDYIPRVFIKPEAMKVTSLPEYFIDMSSAMEEKN